MNGEPPGTWIQRDRLAAGLTQQELAARTNLSVRALRDIEQGRVRRPRAESVRRLAEVLEPPSDPDRVGVLGPLTLTRAGAELPLRTAGQRGLLAVLALGAGRPVSRDEIIWVLWGDEPPKTCVTQVHAAVAALRRVLRTGHVPQAGGVPRLVAGGYLLRPGDVDVDLVRFERLAARAEQARASGARTEALDLYGRSLAEWRGPVLAGAGPRLAGHPGAAAGNRARLAAALAHADLALHLHRYDQAAAPLWSLAADEPYHEGLHAALMRALAGAGERGAALRLHATLRGRLIEELGVEPGDEVHAVYLSILRADGGPITGPDRGGHPDAVPWLVPPDIADFTGRTTEIESLCATLTTHSGAVPVAAVAGMGGVGKSALAVHVAHRLRDSFPDGQLYVNLRGAAPKPADPTDVLGRFLRALGVDSRAVPDSLDERVEGYRTRLASRRVLVVLDDAGSEGQIRPLLPGSASCAVLITGRARLSGMEGARWTDLGVFSPDEAIVLLAHVADDRVHAESAAAAEVARLCGGLPLALRIAGARLTARPRWRVRDLSEMLTDERRRLDHLAAGDLAVRASLALSYAGLPEPARALLRRLSLVDVPDLPAWAATAVGCAPDQLDELVDAHLLSAVGVDAAGQDRYRFHDLVRLYARERAELEDTPREQADAVEAGLGGWLALAESLAVRVPGPCYAAIHGDAPRPTLDPGLAASLDALAWFDTERGSLTAAIRQGCAAGLLDLAFDLAGCLEKYFDLRGMYGEWRAVNEHVMAACRAAGHLRGEAVMLRGLIDVRTWNTGPSGGPAMAELHADAVRLREMFTATGDRSGIADAEVMLSWGLSATGQAAAAYETAERGLALAEQTGHLGGQARAHVALAVACSEQRLAGQTVEHLRTALHLARTLGNPRYEASVLQFLGMAYQLTGELESSREMLAEALGIVRRYQDHYSEALAMLALARLYLKQGDPAASAAAEAALAVGRTYTMTHHTADALGILGEIALAEGRHGDAVTALEESVALWRTRGWPSFLAATLTSLGTAYGPDSPAAARAAFTEALGLYQALGDDERARMVGQLLDA